MGWRIERIRQTGSTNRDVVERARGGEPAGLVVVARDQTQGRGRQGRTWLSEPGRSLTFTVLRRPDVPASDGWRWTLVAGLAVRAAVAPLLPAPGAWLKWPNDVLVGERKVSGVLCELACRGDRVASIALGVGVNLAPPAAGWPPELQGRATSLREAAGRAAGAVDPEELLVSFLAVLPTLEALSTADLLEAATAAMAPMLGRRVRVEGEVEPLEAAGLADNGALLVVQSDGATRRLLAGDVHLLPREEA